MSQVPHNDQSNTPGPRQEQSQPRSAADAAQPGLAGHEPESESPVAPTPLQAKRPPAASAPFQVQVKGSSTFGGNAESPLSDFLVKDAPVSEADSANEMLPGLRPKRVPTSALDSANEALPGFLASANLALSWWRNPAHAAVNTSPLPRIAQPQPRQRGRDTTLIAAILAVLITFSGVFLGAATYHRPTSVPGNARTSVVSATASTYPFSKQPPALSDPLANASHASEYGWTGGKMCSFSSDAYHALADSGRTLTYCLATSRSFSDFSFQVQMSINSGGKGGLVLRADEAKQQFYLLSIDIQGNFDLFVINGATSQMRLSGNAGQAFHQGFHQTNFIAVTVRGNQLSFYFNQNQLQKNPPFAYTDPNPYPGGQLGFFAGYGNSATDVAYSHVQVWQL